MLGVVTARGEDMITYNYRSQCNYTRTKLAIKRWALGLPTRRGRKTWRS